MTGFKILVSGDYACFTRPEMKVERVSYDVITPSAVRGILEAIHWKPAITWVVARIHVLKPIRFTSFRRNEVGSKIPMGSVSSARNSGDISKLGLHVDQDRQQRAMLCLSRVEYGIEARFQMTRHAGPEDTAAKHAEMFRRRAERGQCFHQPYLGVREFPADVRLVEEFPETELPPDDQGRDLGWMLDDFDYPDDGKDALPSPYFYRARMRDGVIDVAECRNQGGAA
ncbi:MAG: type I-C CRISPR-associated protein Cas5 [Rhodobacteraceae bacterium]|nr:type I-C CRISPR-associated protein Cas5 [Paracoccaceae bacterium]